MNAEPAAMSRRDLAEVALGVRPADLLLTNGRVVDVFSGQTRTANVAILGDRIAAVVPPNQFTVSADRVHDVGGAFLVPGLIDTHLHLVACQLSVAELSRQLLTKGTAAVSACFYEAGIVGGATGIEWMIEQARSTPVRFLLSPFLACRRGLGPFGNTDRISDDEFLRLLDDPSVVEVREWNVHVEKRGDALTNEFIARARAKGLVIAGHLEGMSGADLQASVALGASSDHEAVTAAEAMERVQLGVKVQIREGSAAKNFDALIRAITEHGLSDRNFMFCTDGQEVHHTQSRGHIDQMVRRAIAAGIDPVPAIQMASLNAAEYLRIDHDYGSLSPGRIAHINVVGDLEAFEISDVFVGSRQAVRAGATEPAAPVPPPSAALRTVHVARPLTASDMSIRVETAAETVNARVIDVAPGVLTTTERIDQFDVRAGELLLGEDSRTNFIAVIDRHHASGRIGHGLVCGFGLQRGAIASTNSPALMNLMALGTNPADMAVAANRACQLDGGVVVAADGKVLAELALPLFGVLTDAPFETAAQQLQAIEDAIASELGSTFDGLVTMSGFVMMPLSIPGLKLCDRGLVQVSRDRAVPVELICER